MLKVSPVNYYSPVNLYTTVVPQSIQKEIMACDGVTLLNVDCLSDLVVQITREMFFFWGVKLRMIFSNRRERSQLLYRKVWWKNIARFDYRIRK